MIAIARARSTRGRLSSSRCAPAAAARRSAARGRVAEPSRPGDRCRGADRRARARVVEAVGKHLLLRFEGGLFVRSHLRMTGRWRIEPRGKQRAGRPWLVLRGNELEGVLWNGPVLTLEARPVRRLGQDVLAAEIDLDAAVARLRSAGDGSAKRYRTSGSSRDGNMWMSEALWAASLPVGVRARRLRPDAARRARCRTQGCRSRSRPDGRGAGSTGMRAAVPSLAHDPPARAGRRRQPAATRVPGARQEAGRRGVSRTDGGTRTATASHPARLLSRRVRSSSAVRSRKVTNCPSPSRSTCSAAEPASTSTLDRGYVRRFGAGASPAVMTRARAR